MWLYFSQSHTCVTFIEKTYELKTNKNVRFPRDPFHALTSQQVVFIKKDSVAKLISDCMILTGSAVFVYDVLSKFQA